MFSVLLFVLLFAVTTTNDVKLKPIPIRFENSCFVDQYNGIEYKKGILGTKTYDLRSRLESCVYNCYMYENRGCKSVSYIFNAKTNDNSSDEYYLCVYHSDSIIDGEADKADYEWNATSTYYHILGCGASTCGRRYAYDMYTLKKRNMEPVVLDASSDLRWLALVMVHKGDAVRYCSAAFISAYPTSYETDLLLTSGRCVAEKIEGKRKPATAAPSAIVVYPEVKIYPDNVKISLTVADAVLHPNFTFDSPDDGNDLALIKLTKPIRFNWWERGIGIFSICTPTERIAINDNDCIDVGFAEPENSVDEHIFKAIEIAGGLGTPRDGLVKSLFRGTARKDEESFSAHHRDMVTGGMIACLNRKWTLRAITPMKLEGQRDGTSYTLISDHYNWIQASKKNLTSVRQLEKKLKVESARVDHWPEDEEIEI